jgi:alanine racemase
MSRGTTAVINFENLRHNFKVLKGLAPGKLVLVVKADAYGHGLQKIVQALDEVDCFAVATIDEALIIRKYRPSVRVLLLEGFLDKSELQTAIKNKFDCVIHQQEQLEMFSETITNFPINIWLKYDSGMNRLGFSECEFEQAIQLLDQHKNVSELILMSHLASANEKNNTFNTKQAEKFLKFNTNNHQLSLSNSSALLNNSYLPDEWCRVGLALFGVSPIENKQASDFNLKPVMSLQTNIIAIKPVNVGETIGYGQTYTTSKAMVIAIIGIGYGDGYPWSLPETTFVKIQNQAAQIVGRVSMDMMAIDISHINDCNIGDPVLIWGKNKFGHLPIESVASHANSIPYVLLCQITSRVHYHYVE